MYCQVICDRVVDQDESMDWFDPEWNLMPFTGLRKHPKRRPDMPKPENYETMIEIARNLTQGIGINAKLIIFHIQIDGSRAVDLAAVNARFAL